ncbi:prepilin-type processing-associated H-X9-DG domain-containing protein [Abditibacterium utsteinense]|uniref:Prepilin-type processing-associated H-X9-DG domain-containing protein n=1 Tax=Abditibacterium utsteinense TaxID=1960156 RepID=A0A2S8SQ25_9BACT|nr:DUF1559 domain-containing protein [Abditibacterium utsteinense]PQV62898.1 prepilin-type processing-associated H-X9-DG domain-containing protein [Abditibacterium utsteinense]
MNNTRKLLVFLPVLGVFSLVIYAMDLARENARSSNCEVNLKQIGLGLKQYERDYDEKTVLAGNWETALKPYTRKPEIFECPSGNGYAFNRYMSGASYTEISPSKITPTVFDSTSTKLNTSDFGSSYASGAHSRWKRGRGTNVLFFDGHVEWLQKKPIFKAIKPLPTPLPPIIIHEPPIKRDAWGRVIGEIEGTKPR